MTELSPARPIAEVSGPVDVDRFAAIRAAGAPVVMRGLVGDWPLVDAARESDEEVVGYLTRQLPSRPVRAIIAPPSERGRFFYNRELTGFNFQSGEGRLEVFLHDLLRAREAPQPPALAVQSEDIATLLPRVAAENQLALLSQVPPRIWIGNRIRVAPHYDVKENVACCVAGKRRFTLFPPEAIGDLYPGPLEQTPAGTPVSMVELAAPDLATYPRFASAWQRAQAATLEPGDAIYIPYCWWHGVESLEPLSILVNYWWNEGVQEGAGSPYDALLHAMLAIRHLPGDQRAAWKNLFDFYIFEGQGDTSAHLPPHAKGVLGPPSPGLFAQMREIIRRALGQTG